MFSFLCFLSFREIFLSDEFFSPAWPKSLYVYYWILVNLGMFCFIHPPWKTLSLPTRVELNIRALLSWWGFCHNQFCHQTTSEHLHYNSWLRHINFAHTGCFQYYIVEYIMVVNLNKETHQNRSQHNKNSPRNSGILWLLLTKFMWKNQKPSNMSQLAN